MSNLIIDGTALDLYPLGKEGFTGGTETYIRKLAAGLAAKGHVVHVVCADLDAMEMRGPTLFYWGKNHHPITADCVMMAHNLENIGPYSADLLLLLSNGLGSDLGPGDEFATGLDAVACLSQCHVDLLTQAHPKIRKELRHVTGLGVDLGPYSISTPEYWYIQLPTRVINDMHVPGRLLYANDPQRGLWHMIDIFERVQQVIPETTLHITYDWERSFNGLKWSASHMAETFWEIDERIKSNPGITSLGALSKEDLIREQLECQVFAFPCDPIRLGSQLHCLSALEAAAAGAALVLSDSEALPEIFDQAADILPIPGWYDSRAERRFDTQDWADAIVEVMRDPERWSTLSQKARALAETQTWERMVDKFDALLAQLSKGKVAA